MSKWLVEFLRTSALSIVSAGVLYWLSQREIHPERYFAQFLDFALSPEYRVTLLVISSLVCGVVLSCGVVVAQSVFERLNRPSKAKADELRSAAIDVQSYFLNSMDPSNTKGNDSVARMERLAVEYKDHRNFGPILSNAVDRLQEYSLISSIEYRALHGTDDTREIALRTSGTRAIDEILHATRWVVFS